MQVTDYLFVIAGYSNEVDRVASRLNKRFADRNVRFLGRDYPVKAEKREAYVGDLLSDVVERVFGPHGAANFCRSIEKPCAHSDLGGRRDKERLCAGRTDVVACARQRPKMLVALLAPWIKDQFLQRAPRTFLPLEGPHVPPSEDALGSYIEDVMPTLTQIRNFLLNLPLNQLAVKLPVVNFQSKNDCSLTQLIQSHPEELIAAVREWQDKLYDSSIQNPRRRIRGGYRLTAEVTFQRDRLHDEARLGDASRGNVAHLLAAHHDYGAAVLPGLHFDVFRTGGSAIAVSFTDILIEEGTSAKATHVNITPCDRAWE